MTQLDISNLSNCIEDARIAALDQDNGPDDELNFDVLRGRLHASRPKIPPLYRQAALDPFLATLNDLGRDGFNQVLLEDPNREGLGRLMLDISRALLQRGEGFQTKPLAAFQEVVSDLYDGFLSVEDRKGINPPDLETLPPLVEAGNALAGPYTFTAPATANFGLKAAIVNLPPSNLKGGLLAWPALAHETVGHDVLHADLGLLAEVATAVRRALDAESDTRSLAGYWASRIDETASDVLGILNMGPAPAIGLLGYFRALNAAFGFESRLRNDGPASDPHPADIVRGYLGAETVRQLAFSEAGTWADVIERETDKDVTLIRLDGRNVDKALAKKSAQIVARAIVTTPMAALEQHAFGEIQNWRDEDEDIVASLRFSLQTANVLPNELVEGAFAAHLVAAATTAALESGANVNALFRRTLDLLKVMNERNASFGPMAVRHPGDVRPDRFYMPQPLLTRGVDPKRRHRVEASYTQPRGQT